MNKLKKIQGNQNRIAEGPKKEEKTQWNNVIIHNILFLDEQ